MDLIDRYVHEVGQHLPHRMRGDVEAELRSLLTDSVEERARAEGVAASDALAGAVLRGFGTPKDVAARYGPEPQYLIGPRLYPVYVVAVKVMLPVLTALVVALVVAGRFQEPGEQGLQADSLRTEYGQEDATAPVAAHSVVGGVPGASATAGADPGA